MITDKQNDFLFNNFKENIELTLKEKNYILELLKINYNEVLKEDKINFKDFKDDIKYNNNEHYKLIDDLIYKLETLDLLNISEQYYK